MPTPQPTVRSSRARAALEHRSDSGVQWLSGAPAWLVPVVLAVLILGGIALRGIVGGVLLGVAALFVAWLAVLTWPRNSLLERMFRLSVLLLIVALAVVCGASSGLLV